MLTVLHKNTGDHPRLGRLRPPRADRRSAACVQLRGLEPARRQPRGNFSSAGDLADRDDRNFSIVYRIGPSRSDARWSWSTLGSALAAVLLVAVSMIFTWYVAEFNSYNRIYGSLGAAVGFMTWIWLSVVIVLIGAELNAKSKSERPGVLQARCPLSNDLSSSAAGITDGFRLVACRDLRCFERLCGMFFTGRRRAPGECSRLWKIEKPPAVAEADAEDTGSATEAPTVRFITFETLVTASEPSMRLQRAYVFFRHRLMTRRAVSPSQARRTSCP